MGEGGGRETYFHRNLGLSWTRERGEEPAERKLRMDKKGTPASVGGAKGGEAGKLVLCKKEKDGANRNSGEKIRGNAERATRRGAIGKEGKIKMGSCEPLEKIKKSRVTRHQKWKKRG